MIITIDTEKRTFKTNEVNSNDDNYQEDQCAKPFTINDMVSLLTVYDAYEALDTMSGKLCEIMDDLSYVGDLVNRFSSLYDEKKNLYDQEHTMVLKDPRMDRWEKARILMYGK